MQKVILTEGREWRQLKQGRTTAMFSMSRRSAIRGSLSAAAAATLACPYIANAQAKTAVYWAGQGFIPQEDAAMR
jgi:hypothetical protein